MAKIHRTSRGDAVDMDMVRLSNESTIAVGNMRTNARGDELGPGGKVIKTRAQLMAEYHKLNTPVSVDSPISDSNTTEQVQPDTNLVTPFVVDSPVTETTDSPQFVKPRGSFAESIAEQTEVNQELLQPAALRDGPKGVTRI
jgi:hypothetical protein